MRLNIVACLIATISAASASLPPGALFIENDNATVFLGHNADTNLYRSAKNALQTDGDLHVKGKLSVGGADIYELIMTLNATAHSQARTIAQLKAQLATTVSALNTTIEHQASTISTLQNTIASLAGNGSDSLVKRAQSIGPAGDWHLLNGSLNALFPTSYPRTGLFLVSMGSDLFVAGGLPHGSAYAGSNDVWSSPDGISWTLIQPAAPWHARLSHGVVVFNNHMFVMGGYYETPGPTTYFNDVWRSSDGVSWTFLGNAPWSPRTAQSALAYNSTILLVGGTGLNCPLSSLGYVCTDVWKTLDGAIWTKVGQFGPHVPSSIWAIPPLVFNGMLVAVGQQIWTSDDALTWTMVSSPEANYPINSVAVVFGESVFSIVGPTVWQSSGSDLLRWTPFNQISSWGSGPQAAIVFKGQILLLNNIWELWASPSGH